MTAPVDRVYVEVLPLFKNFNKTLQSQVTAGVSGAAREMEKVSSGVNTAVGTSAKKVTESVGESAKGVSKEVERGAREVAEHSEGLFSRVKEGAKDLFLSFGPLAAGFGAVEFIKGSIEAADEVIKLTRQTQAVIKSTGEAAHVSAKDVGEYADKLSEQSGITADTIRNNENLLLTFTGIRNEVGKGNDIFTRATATVLDMSVALKEDGKSASIQLGKALNDPIKGITALSRVGVSFTEQQKKTIKSMVEHNNVLGAQKIILGELTREFGGSAAAQATAGQKLKASYHQVEEEVGAKLLPVIEHGAEFITHKVIPAFMSMFDDAQRGTGVFGALRHVWETLEVTLKPIAAMVISFAKQGWKYLGDILENQVVPALKVVNEWVAKHGTLVRTVAVGLLAGVAAFKALTIVTRAYTAVMAALDVVMDANPIGIVVIALAALVAGFIYAYKHSKAFRDEVNTLARNVVASWNDIKTNVTASIRDITNNVTQSWHDIKTNVTGSVHDINHNVTSSVHDINHNVSASWRDISHNVSASLHDIAHGISVGWNGIVTFFTRSVPALGSSIVNGLWSGLKGAWNTVVGWFRSIPGWIKSALGIHSPPAWAVDAGAWIMKALVKGLIGGAFSFTNFLNHFTTAAQSKLASFAHSIGSGFTTPSGTLLGWIQAAEKLTGVNAAWTPGLLTLIGRESGGNPNAINNWDINAQHGDPSRGLMQTIGSTFAHYHQPGTSWNIYDPVANISAGIRYILARYGGIWNVQQADPTRPPKGYAVGSWNVPNDQLAYVHQREMIIPARQADKIRATASSSATLDDVLGALLGILDALRTMPPDISDGVGRHLGAVVSQANHSLGRLSNIYTRTA